MCLANEQVSNHKALHQFLNHWNLKLERLIWNETTTITKKKSKNRKKRNKNYEAKKNINDKI